MSSIDFRVAQAGDDILTAIDISELREIGSSSRQSHLTRRAFAAVVLASFGVLGVTYLSDRPGPSTRPAASEWTARAGDILAQDAVRAGSLVGWALTPAEQSAAMDATGLAGTVELSLSDGSGGELLVSLRLNDPAAAALESVDTSDLLREGDSRVYLRAESFDATAVELYHLDSVLYVRWESKAVTPEQLAEFALQLDTLWRTTADAQFEARSTLMVEVPDGDA